MTQLIVAIDTDNIEYAWFLMRATRPHCAMFKIGSEFFTAHGPRAAAYTDHPLFLDLKWHDIPSTVAKSVGAALPLNPAMLTVHAAGGAEMVRVAASAAKGARVPPLLIAVTRLTSLAPDDGETLRLARLALNSGADGLVCSVKEIAMLRYTLGDAMKLVVPGIRTRDAHRADDQTRVGTPEEAKAAGADYIVVGRPITGAKDPGAAAKAIAESIR